MIDHINKIAEIWWNWMWPMFWQVSILICFVAAVDFILRKYIWPQVRYALWLLVLVKLILPPSFALPTSVFSNIQPFFVNSSQQHVTIERPAPYEIVNEYSDSSDFSTLPVMHPELSGSTGVIESTDQIETSNNIQINLSWHAIAMIVWMLITILLLLRLFVRHSLLLKANYDNKSD